MDPQSITDYDTISTDLSNTTTNTSTCTNHSTHTGTPMEIFSVKAHDGMVNVIDGIGGSRIGCGAPELVTGGRDGKVFV